ncbi:MAG TPA: type II secretion system protein GspG [Terriglobia bacterium]|nr:type II secretion system protein GspG [Terriglobia bacterium]
MQAFENRPQSQGFTLLEIAIVMAIIAVLAGILTPVVMNYVEQARVTAAQADVIAIRDAITRFERDMGRFPMFNTGTGGLPDSSGDRVRLEGPGNAPKETVVSAWTSATPTDSDCTSGCGIGSLVDQLMTNAPAYPTTTNLAKPFKWKGPYISPQADPWGNKYLVNIINAKSGSADACFVLSAGPDGRVDTPFNISETSQAAPTGDDIIARIR